MIKGRRRDKKIGEVGAEQKTLDREIHGLGKKGENLIFLIHRFL